jgi:ABC-type nitrate/sulfonate/bicarbonate transport system permease component
MDTTLPRVDTAPATTLPPSASLRRRGAEGRARAFPWPSLLIVVTLLLIWELGVRVGVISALFYPAPSTIARTLVKFIANGQMALNVGTTLSRLFTGLLLGGIPGLLLGLLMGWSPRLRAVIDPLVAAMHPIPKISLLPLVMIIFGIGETSKIVLIAIATFFPMLINTVAGVRQIHPIHFEVAQNYRASRLNILRYLVLPGSLPSVLTGLRLAVNIALLITMSTELVSARTGLGAMIWLAWETLRTEELFAALVVIATLGTLFSLVLQWLSQRLVPWQVERHA